MHIHDVNKHETLMVYCGSGDSPVANRIEGFGCGLFRTNPDIELSPSHFQALSELSSMYDGMDDAELAARIVYARQILLADKIRRLNKGEQVTIFASEIEQACPHLMHMAHR